MLLAIITEGAGRAKAGWCHLAQPAIQPGGRRVVLVSALKYSLGEDHVF